MSKIKEGDTFATLQDFKDALRRWAIEEKWTPHIHDSDRNRVRAGCRSAPGCPFRIRANFNGSRGYAQVTTCDGEHTCFETRGNENPLHQNIKRSETGKLRFLLEAVPNLLRVDLDTPVQEIVDAVERKYGQRIPVRQAQKVKNGLTPRVLGPCRQCRQDGHTRRHCPQLRHVATDRNEDSMIRSSHNSPREDRRNDEPGRAENGPEKSFGTNPAPKRHADTNSDIPRAHPPTAHQDAIPQPRSSAYPVDPVLTSGVYAASSTPRDFSLRDSRGPVLPPLNATGSAGQTRTEAYRLMQQAADDMKKAGDFNKQAASLTEQAAEKNSRAAELMASVAR